MIDPDNKPNSEDILGPFNDDQEVVVVGEGIGKEDFTIRPMSDQKRQELEAYLNRAAKNGTGKK